MAVGTRTTAALLRRSAARVCEGPRSIARRVGRTRRGHKRGWGRGVPAQECGTRVRGAAVNRPSQLYAVPQCVFMKCGRVWSQQP